ncbi:uncharacterized protein [Clytia hemisphaerica]|uniref:uncharacterized protein isoform X1 n=1 Tax=Clytia hemisphaerica TaxID=252671 RepID=UPI0034D3DF06
MAQVDKAVTGIVSQQDEFLTMMQPFDQMSAKLSGAPMAINILGQLCYIATGVEVDLRVEGVNEKYKHLTNTNSLRACLMQVSQAGQRAFRTADGNMEYISMSCERVPGLMKSALKILLSPESEPSDIQNFLPERLLAIKKVSDDAKVKCEEVVKEFTHVIEVIEEVQLGALAKQTDVKTALEHLQLNIDNAKRESERLDQVTKANEKALKDMEGQVKSAKEDWKDAMASMPSAQDLMMASLTESLTSIVKTGANAAVQMGTQYANMMTMGGMGGMGGMPPQQMGGMQNPQQAPNQNVQYPAQGTHVENPKVDFVRDEYMVKNSQINLFANLLLNYFDDSEGDIKLREKVVEKGDKDIPVGKILEAETFFNMMKKNIKGMDAGDHKTTKNQLMKLIDNALKTIEGIQKLPESVATIQKLFGQAEKIISQSDTIGSSLKVKAGISQFNNPNPTLPPSQAPSGSSGNLSENMIDNAHKKVEAHRSELNSLRNRAEEEKKRFDASEQALAEELRRLENFKSEDATSKRMIEVLNQGLDALNKVKQKWVDLLQFFTSLSNLINSTLAPSLNMFVADAEKVAQSARVTNMAKETVYQTAYQAVKVNHVVNHLAGSYKEISKKYLMPLCLKLDEILILDANQDKAKLEKLRLELGAECRKAQEDIKRIVDKHHEEFLANCHKKTSAIDTEMRAIAPITEEKKKQIQANAQKMVKGEELDFGF